MNPHFIIGYFVGLFIGIIIYRWLSGCDHNYRLLYTKKDPFGYWDNDRGFELTIRTTWICTKCKKIKQQEIQP